MTLTRPERFAGLQKARELVEKVKACPCAFCLHRDATVIGWGRAICRERRTWPKCTESGSPGFELDETTLEGRG